MQELFDLVHSYARAIWLKRWFAVAVAWFVCVIGWAVVMKLPDQFQATARVNVDTRSYLKPLLQGLAFNSSTEQQVQLMVTTLLSRPNLEKIARITDLDLTAQSDQEMDDLLERLKSRISLSKPDRRQDIYEIRYTDEDRDIAKKVVQAVITVFSENTLGENRQDEITMKRFLEAEIKDYQRRLKEAEDKVVEFKRKNVGFLSSGNSDYYQRLQAAMAELETSNLQLVEAKKQRDAVQEQIDDQEEELQFLFDSTSESTGSTVYDQRISVLQSRLDEMFLKYTDQHPDVITLKSQIEDLKVKRDEILSKRSGVANGNSENPILQSLKLSFGRANAEVAALEARVQAHRSRVSDLQKLVHTVPQIEAEAKDLTRDYEIIKNKYNELITKREQANITQSANLASDEIEFKTVDPTRVPFEPSGPPRILFLSAVFVGGIAAGVGFALFLVLLKPTFSSARLLGLKTGLPVLGTVTLAQNAMQISLKRRYLFLFLATAFLLIVSYSTLMLYQMLSGLPQIPFL